MSAEILKLVIPSAIKMGVQGSGGIPEVTSQDVAAALSTLPEHISRYARLKYTMSKEEQAELLRWNARPVSVLDLLWARAQEIGKDWPIGKTKLLVEIVTLLDVMPDVCPTCHGVRQRLIEDKLHECPACSGTGVRKVKQQDIAEYLGVNLRTYQRVWSERHKELAAELGDWDYRLRKKLRNKLK